MKNINISLTVLSFICILQSCASHSTGTDPVLDSTALSDSVMRNIQTAPAQEEEVAEVIKLNGKIEPDESKQAKVYALVSGKIQSVKVELGDYVKKGQMLAELKSTEVAGVTNDLSLAESNLGIAKKALQTTKDLYDGKLATEQDLNNAQLEYNKALSELNRAKEVRSITGGRSGATYAITAPLSGYVIEKNITNNSEVRSDNSADLFAIADLSKVWIIANVYEADLNNIHLGDEVTVNTLADPTKNYIGKVDKIYNVLDPATRTMRVRISMDNPKGELRPEMFATIKVNGKPAGKMVTIPAQALVLDNSRNYVIVKKGKQLETREIQLDRRVDNKAYISGGLAAGEEVVTNSQVFIYQSLNTK
jgi:cobalt-zinc-cadmium efflux system membrane fusion protein